MHPQLTQPTLLKLSLSHKCPRSPIPSKPASSTTRPHMIHTSTSWRYPPCHHRLPSTARIAPYWPLRDSQLNQHGENEQSEAHSQPRCANSTFSRLGPSQNTNPKDHQGPQHRPETYRENRCKRDLMKDIEKKIWIERAKRRLNREKENERRQDDRSPEPLNHTGCTQPSNADMLNTIIEQKRKLEGGN